MDVHTKKQRSFNMSRVKSKNTKPELVLFKALQKKGIKFKRHYNNIAGKPDVAFSKEKIASPRAFFQFPVLVYPQKHQFSDNPFEQFLPHCCHPGA